MDKKPKSQPPPIPVPPKIAVQTPPQSGALAITSMILGIISLTGPGFLLGIPAIVIAAIALKRKEGERGLSIIGLVTGIISTVISLLLITLITLAIIWGINHPENVHDLPYPDHVDQQLDDSGHKT